MRATLFAPATRYSYIRFPATQLKRTLLCSRRKMSQNHTQQLEGRSVEEAVQTLTKVGGLWSLTKDGLAIERALKFKTFKAAWAFMDAVSMECKAHRHHPEWSNIYNQVYIRWTTHSASGLTEKDVTMAQICDEISQRADSKALEEDPQNVGVLQELANDVKARAGDCCKR